MTAKKFPSQIHIPAVVENQTFTGSLLCKWSLCLWTLVSKCPMLASMLSIVHSNTASYTAGQSNTFLDKLLLHVTDLCMKINKHLFPKCKKSIHSLYTCLKWLKVTSYRRIPKPNKQSTWVLVFCDLFS